MNDDRFSEKEVSLVLRRAAEIDADAGAGHGLSSVDVAAVATEAGISPEAVRRAILELKAESAVTGRSILAPASRRASRSIAGTLSREGLAELVRTVEERVGRPGSVTEALDTVRWTSSSGTWTTQVAIDSRGDETRIGVHERVSDRARRILHVLPTGWGMIAGVAIAGSAGLAALPSVLLVAAASAVGFGAGRGIFGVLSNRSRNRVEGLAADLCEDARGLGAE
jgi:hypothetical protein